MNDTLEELYQEIILEHSKEPINFGNLEGCTNTAEGHNPFCGDKIELQVTVEDGLLKDISFTGQGCAISVASASIMTEHVKGKSIEEILEDIKTVQGILIGKKELDNFPHLESIKPFEGVKKFPIRVKCATLAWHTLKSALLP